MARPLIQGLVWGSHDQWKWVIENRNWTSSAVFSRTGICPFLSPQGLCTELVSWFDTDAIAIFNDWVNDCKFIYISPPIRSPFSSLF